jgi:hypothetical protein
MSGAFAYHCFIVCSSSRLLPSCLHNGTQRGVQSMGPIFIPLDLNIEHREIHGKPLPQETVLCPPKPQPIDKKGLREYGSSVLSGSNTRKRFIWKPSEQKLGFGCLIDCELSIVEENTTVKSTCARCRFRDYAERKPNSLLARIWRWHTGWCPGWKAYQRELAEKGNANTS